MPLTFVTNIMVQGWDGHACYMSYPYVYNSEGYGGSYKIIKCNISDTTSYVAISDAYANKIIGIDSDGTYLYTNFLFDNFKKFTTALTYVASSTVQGSGRDTLVHKNTVFFNAGEKLQAIGKSMTALASLTNTNGTTYGLTVFSDHVVCAGDVSGKANLFVVSYDESTNSFSHKASYTTAAPVNYWDVATDGEFIYTSEPAAYRFTGSSLELVATGSASLAAMTAGVDYQGQGVYCYGGKIYLAETNFDPILLDWNTPGRVEVLTFNGSSFVSEQVIGQKEDGYDIKGDNGYIATSGDSRFPTGFAGKLYQTDTWAPVSVSVNMTV